MGVDVRVAARRHTRKKPGLEVTMDTAVSTEEARSLQKESFGSDLREQSVLKSLEAVLPGHHRFLDVGANIGQYSYFGEHSRDAVIISIEANPALMELLRDTIKRANAEDLHNNTFRIINKAISDFKEKLAFYIEPMLTTSSIFKHSDDHPIQKVIEVDSIKLDELHVPGLRTFVKLDIEGAEYRALLGCKELLASPHTTFLIEVHPWEIASASGTHFTYVP